MHFKTQVTVEMWCLLVSSTFFMQVNENDYSTAETVMMDLK